MTEVAIEFRPVMRREMRISRFDAFCLFRKLCRAAMAGNTLLHGRNFQLMVLSMTLFTSDVCQQMIVAPRQLFPYLPVLFGMTSLARLKIHDFGIRVRLRQFSDVPMTSGALAATIFCLFSLGSNAGLAEYNRRHDAEQNRCWNHCATPPLWRGRRFIGRSRAVSVFHADSPDRTDMTAERTAGQSPQH